MGPDPRVRAGLDLEIGGPLEIFAMGLNEGEYAGRRELGFKGRRPGQAETKIDVAYSWVVSKRNAAQRAFGV
jgi:hypothetical protein